MVIDKIGTFTNIQSVYSNQIRRESGTEAAERKSERNDRVEISDSRRLSVLREAVTKAAREAQEVREDKVAAAKEKLQNGTLITDQVVEEIANRIVDSMGL